MNNILQYPVSTIVDSVIPKNAFYRKATVTQRMKTRFVDELQELRWLYKLAPQTLNIEGAKEIEEVQIFLAVLKQKTIPIELLRFIDTVMPQFIVFILQYQNNYCLFCNYKHYATQAHDRCEISESFATEWSNDVPDLHVYGRTTAAIYDNFIRQIAGNRLEQAASIAEDIATMQQKEAIQKRIEKLEILRSREQQPHKKFELHRQIQRLKEDLK